MIRGALLGIVLLLLLLPSACVAQEETVAAPVTASSTGADATALPNFDARMVSGESVVDLADFISSSLDATGAVPELAQVRTVGGTLRTLNAAEVFVLLARTAYLWRNSGNMPATVPITPDEVSIPVLDPEDVVSPPTSASVGREVPTESFLSQSSAVVRWVDLLRVIPTAVWVDGQRLSSADYLGGLAICVSYAYWEGQLYDTVFLPAYAPPPSWITEAEPVYAQTTTEQPVAETTSPAAQTSVPVPKEQSEYSEQYGTGSAYEEQSAPGYGEYNEEGLVADENTSTYEDQGATAEEVAPTQSESEAQTSQGPPTLELTPQPGETVSGLVDIVADYNGPPARFAIFTIDGAHEVLMNSLPYSYRWDTSNLEPGTHQVRVQILDDDDTVLVDQTNAYFVAPSR